MLNFRTLVLSLDALQFWEEKLMPSDEPRFYDFPVVSQRRIDVEKNLKLAVTSEREQAKIENRRAILLRQIEQLQQLQTLRQEAEKTATTESDNLVPGEAETRQSVGSATQ